MRCQDNGGLSIGNATRVERSHPQLDFITACTDGIPEGLDELLAPGVEGAFHSREELLVRGGMSNGRMAELSNETLLLLGTHTAFAQEEAR